MTQRLSGPMVAPQSGEAPKQIVVLLHGYGSDGNDLIGLAPYWRSLLPDALFVAPHAPHRCEINPMGYQWFPLDLDRDMSRLIGAEAARPVIAQFLADLWAETGLGAEQTLLGGFSQGAMMALETGLRLDDELLGILAFSGGLVAPKTMETEIRSKPKVQLIHGAEDDVVPVGMSVMSAETLKGLGVDARLHISPGAGHTIAQDGLEVASRYIAELAGPYATSGG